MRTTLTIDDDVAKELESRMRREGTSLKALVNDLLRKGLRAGDKPLPRRGPVRIETFSSPFAPGVDHAKLNQLNDELETAEFLRKRGGRMP
jgi:hypothetical protein